MTWFLRLLGFLVALSGACAMGNNLDRQWSEAVGKHQSVGPDSAIPLYEAFLAAAAAKGVRSPEAHYNLALAYKASGDAGRAAFHLLEASSLRRSPIRSWSDLRLLNGWETESGVRDGASASVGLRLAIAVGRGLGLILLCLAAWALAGYGLMHWMGWASDKRRVARYAAFSVAGALVVTAAGVEWNARQWERLGVVAGGSEGGVVFASPSSEPAGKLAELPSGTVVRITDEENGFLHVDVPIAGWIAHERVLRRGEKNGEGQSAVACLDLAAQTGS